MEGTSLIYRTQPGSVTIPANSTITLTKDLPYGGSLIVKQYQSIRLVCGNRNSSNSPVTITITMKEGRELIGSLISIILDPGKGFTSVYEIPGTALSITANAGDGDSFIDLFVYGHFSKHPNCR